MTIVQDAPAKHMLFTMGGMWGHVRPAQAIIFKLLCSYPNLRITLILSGSIGAKAAQDRKRYRFEDYVSRFKVHNISVGPRGGAALVPSIEYAAGVMPHIVKSSETLAQILKGEAVYDTLLEKDIHPIVPAPTVVIMDIANFPLVAGLRETFSNLALPAPTVGVLAPLSTPGWAWLSYNNRNILNSVVPEADQIAAYEKYVANSYEVVQLPGCAPFYEFESDPTNSTQPLFAFLKAYHDTIPLYDAVFVGWPSTLGSKEMTEHGEKITGGKRFYQIGVALPEENDNEDRAEEFAVEDNKGDSLRFLDTQLQSRGVQSVLYIAFGSLDYPPSKDQLFAVLDLLDEKDIPYLLSEGNAPDEAKEALPDRIKASKGNGLLAQWTPQWNVLNHPATMAFVSHGGSNSAVESLLAGVPTIQWPSSWDQPALANQLATACVAFELFQGRRAHNIGRASLRGPTVLGTPEALADELRGYLTTLQGSEGIAMRARAKSLGDKIRADQSPGGQSYNDLLAMGVLGDH